MTHGGTFLCQVWRSYSIAAAVHIVRKTRQTDRQMPVKTLSPRLPTNYRSYDTMTLNSNNQPITQEYYHY